MKTEYPQVVNKSASSDFTTRARRLIPYFLGGLGVALMVGGGAINYYKTSQNAAGPVKEKPEVAAAGVELKAKMIKIDISGAVERPGVYEMPNDSRIENVLIAAGGLGAKADRIYVSKNINLAQRLVDGTKVYIPFQSETNTSNTVTQLTSNTININSATTDQLDALPGIGPVTAGKIILGRPYQNVSELVSRKVVAQSVFDKIKDQISVY